MLANSLCINPLIPKCSSYCLKRWQHSRHLASPVLRMIWLVLQLLYYDVQCKWRKWRSALARYEQDFPMQMLHEIEAPSRGKPSCCCKRGTVYCTSKTNLATCNQPFISISAWTRLTQLNSDKLSIDRYLTGYSAGFELRGNEGTAVHPRYLHVPKVNTSNFVELTFAKLSLCIKKTCWDRETDAFTIQGSSFAFDISASY